MLLGGGSWWTGERIAHEALALHPYVPRASLVAVGVGTGSVTLRGDKLDARRAGTYGAFWPGGFGQIYGRVRVDGDVTRSLRVLSGHRPLVGDRVGLTLDGWQDPRLALGVAPRDVTYRSSAGVLPAWWVPGRGSTWAVLVHGKGGTRAQVLKSMRVPVRLGIPSLAIGYRNDLGTPQDPSGEYRYGETEWEDLDAAVAWAQARGATRVVLMGASMGGAVVASFLEHSPRAGLVSGILLDAPLLSLDPAIDVGVSQRSLPVVGRVPGPVTWLAKRVATLRHGLSWSSVDHLDDTSWLRVPALVFHGTADSTVPWEQSASLAAAHPDLVLLVADEGVAHLRSWNHDPARYEAAERAFLLRVS
jgi:dienelactone hydrolase